MAKTNTDPAAIAEALTRAVDTMYPSADALKRELASGRRLRIYLGIDPTSPHLHLGHATKLWTLRRFQDLGHEIILLMGDFTARIGDPTDKVAARQPLTEKEIKANLKTFKEQASKILSFTGQNAAKLMFNSKWHATMKFGDLISLAQNFTVQQMLERDMFQERLKSHKPIGLHEFFYPLMQGYDSVAMDVDVELGGTDQTFNMLAGRTLMKILKHKEKYVIVGKLLVDPVSGRKLSKTDGSLVNLDDTPTTMFGGVMAMPDEMIRYVAELATNMPMHEVEKLRGMKNPRDAKLALAFEIVKTYHGEKEARKAQEAWINTFSKKEIPAELVSLSLEDLYQQFYIQQLGGIAVGYVVAKILKSNSEARRLIKQKAIDLNGETVSDFKKIIDFKSGDVLRIGKHQFYRIDIGRFGKIDRSED